MVNIVVYGQMYQCGDWYVVPMRRYLKHGYVIETGQVW